MFKDTRVLFSGPVLKRVDLTLHIPDRSISILVMRYLGVGSRQVLSVFGIIHDISLKDKKLMKVYFFRSFLR